MVATEGVIVGAGALEGRVGVGAVKDRVGAGALAEGAGGLLETTVGGGSTLAVLPDP